MITPHVLVVMPLYNAREYVKTAIESILAQTYPFYNFLVINDGSTDGSEQIAESYKNRGVILSHQKNQGPGEAMNRAIQYALDSKIQFIARIDADDISLPDRLEKQIALMQKFPNSAACSANCYYIDPESEEIIGTSTVPTSNKMIHCEITNGLRGLIQGVTLFRTEALFSIGGYRNKFKLAEETDVFLRLAENFELINSKDFLAKIRLNSQSLSMSNVHNNIVYQFYAMECAKKRRENKTENNFGDYMYKMSWATRFSIWHEEFFLKLWRFQLGKHNPLMLITAALFDPRRVLFRLLRKILEKR